ncbi:hypothetical protein GCM10010315_31860 [Streptomyces luteosporeus]|uniref:Uncharacterized protein n=1 Tax=Streptomyces luteosporeus TaxID=173856 RepID=A0ABN3TTT8_9ACTN
MAVLLEVFGFHDDRAVAAPDAPVRPPRSAPVRGAVPRTEGHGHRAARKGEKRRWRGVRSRSGDPDRHEKCTGRQKARVTALSTTPE